MISTVGHLREVLAEFPDYYLVQIEACDEEDTSHVLDVRKVRDTVYLSSELPPHCWPAIEQIFEPEEQGS